MRPSALSIRAQVQAARGRHDVAITLLASMDVQEPWRTLATSVFYARAYERFLLGEFLRASGRYEEAIGWFASLVGVDTGVESPFWAMAEFRQAQLLDDSNRPREAMRHYVRALELWENADPAYGPLIAQARRNLEDVTTRAARAATRN